MHKMYCDWAKGSELLQAYHDNEWGIALSDDRAQFEHLMLEALQCGLSWSLILHRREIFHKCFDGFDFEKIARYTPEDAERILNTEGMLRSMPKINAVIRNARCFLDIRREFGTFSEYIRSFAGDKTICYRGHAEGNIPTCNGLSARIAKDLKKRGFRYLGAITVYSYLQACGIINDHDGDCPCFRKINDSFLTVQIDPDSEVGTKNYR